MGSFVLNFLVGVSEVGYIWKLWSVFGILVVMPPSPLIRGFSYLRFTMPPPKKKKWEN
jgi:hypothetical protein